MKIIPNGLVIRLVKLKKTIKEFQRGQFNNKKFKRLFKEYANTLSDNRFTCSWEDCMPFLNDSTTELTFDPQYLYHTAWAARKLKENMPNKHIDISSWSYFVSIASAFIEIDFYEYLTPKITLSGLNCFQGDLINLPFNDESLESISCMHTVEHVGLGRYGDPIDPKGDIKAINELKRVTQKNGIIYFVVPIGGTAKIHFNAHRIYTYSSIIELFDGFNLLDFSLITNEGNFVESAEEKDADIQTSGCGCFLFQKKI